jgi:hypothetical protein
MDSFTLRVFRVRTPSWIKILAVGRHSNAAWEAFVVQQCANLA